MQVIGLCRFSYPALGGFQVEHASIADRRAYLYTPARMEERFQHFEAFTLPSLSAQTDKDFTLIVLIGDDLPKPYFDRLMDVTRSVTQIQVVSRPPRPHRDVCQEVINSTRNMDDACLEFRHDDDYAVAVTFVQRLREAAYDVAPLLESHRLVGFDFNRGFVARADGRGLCAEETVTPYWGVALAVGVRPLVRQSIMNFGHNRLNRFMPTLTFTHEPMYVRAHNTYNDSRQKPKVPPMDLPRLDALGEAAFKETFNIDVDRVRDIFG